MGALDRVTDSACATTAGEERAGRVELKARAVRGEWQRSIGCTSSEGAHAARTASMSGQVEHS